MSEQKIISESESQPANQLLNELNEQKKISEERLNQIKYLHADFDNYRKNLDKERNNIIEYANEEMISELIVILDDFENSLKISDNKSKQGLSLIYEKLYRILSNYGLEKIETKGKVNPEFHEVLLKEKSDKEEGEIIEVIQTG